MLSNDFCLMHDEKSGDFFIVSKTFDLCIKVKKNGYVPKSAFLLTSSLNQFDFAHKKVLDLGCGETGILAHYALARKASRVVGLDIDPSAIAHVKNCSSKSSEATWIVSDLFNNLSHDRFNVILANPPQLPMSDEDRMTLIDWHDASGSGGRELIERLLLEAIKYLEPSGEIFMLTFDFLGIIESYNHLPSLSHISRELGYSISVIETFSKPIRLGGKTEQNLPWIRKVYPRYVFQISELGIHFKMSIVHFKFNLS